MAAFLVLAITFTIALDKDRRDAFEKRNQGSYLTCLAGNKSREQANYQFSLLIESNKEIVQLFRSSGEALAETQAPFKELGKEYQVAAARLEKIFGLYKLIPEQNCNRVKVP